MTKLIHIVVDGSLPPAKGEAKSMLSAGHVHAARVVALLEAARDAMVGNKLLVGPVSLDVVVRAPRGVQLSDATNLLGGIGDVLQARTTGADVAHLGDLGTVACFQDDAQIAAITYKQKTDDKPGYDVFLSEL